MPDINQTILEIVSHLVRQQPHLAPAIVQIASSSIQNQGYHKIFSQQNIEDTFTAIYDEKYWGDDESTSGPGSTLKYTENLRKALPEVINKLKLNRIFDAPCGDFNWMKHVLSEIDIEYIGGDVVRSLIDSHNQKYSNSKTTFIHIDLTKDVFPQADLMICRDCLFHLSFQDTEGVISNYLASGIPYLFATTHINKSNFSNKDIKTGSFRLIDLFSSPHSFPADPMLRVDDWIPGFPEREMCLWSREQILKARLISAQTA